MTHFECKTHLAFGTLFRVKNDLDLYPRVAYGIRESVSFVSGDIIMYVNWCQVGAYWFLTSKGLLCWNVTHNVFHNLEEL